MLSGGSHRTCSGPVARLASLRVRKWHRTSDRNPFAAKVKISLRPARASGGAQWEDDDVTEGGGIGRTASRDCTTLYMAISHTKTVCLVRSISAGISNFFSLYQHSSRFALHKQYTSSSVDLGQPAARLCGPPGDAERSRPPCNCSRGPGTLRAWATFPVFT